MDLSSLDRLGVKEMSWQLMHIIQFFPKKIILKKKTAAKKVGEISFKQLFDSFNLNGRMSLVLQHEVGHSWKFNAPSHSNKANFDKRRGSMYFCYCFDSCRPKIVVYQLEFIVIIKKMFDSYVFVDEVPKNDNFSVRIF